MNLRKFQETGEDRGAWHAVVHGAAKSDTTERLNNYSVYRGQTATGRKRRSGALGSDGDCGTLESTCPVQRGKCFESPVPFSRMECSSNMARSDFQGKLKASFYMKSLIGI